MKKITALSLVVATSLFAAPLKSLQFDGLIHLSPEMASEMIDMRAGDSVDMEKIDKAVKTLYKQNYFEDVWIEEVGEGALVVHVKEKPVIAKIDLVGISDSDKDEINKLIGIKKGEVYDVERAEASKLKIIKFYEDKGYFDTVVESKTTPLTEKLSISLDFVINRGENVVIKKVTLCGSKALSYNDVEPNIANKSEEWLPWMWGFNDGKLRTSDIEHDSARIKDTYMQKGYLDCDVSQPFLKTYLDSYTADLVYNVNEGEQYKVGTIGIEIPEGFIDVQAVIAEMNLQNGKVFNVSKLRKDMTLIETKVADQGYAFVKIVPDVKNDKENHIANITYRVMPGEKVYINNVRISGNSRTIDRVVRREIYLANGDMYSRTDVDDTKKALKRTGYFEDVEIKEERISKDRMDIVVNVKEASTGSIGGGIGYGSSDGLLLSASVSDGNIFGSGLRAGIDVERSDSELNGAISLANPRLFDSVYSLSGKIYGADNTYYYYDQKKYGINVVLGRKIARNWGVSLGYIIEQDKLSNLTNELQPYKNILWTDETTIKSSVVPGISFNNTDDYYLPRSGISASSSLEIAGLGGDEKFMSSVNKFATYYGLQDLIDYDLILRYKAQFKYLAINSADEKYSYGEKYYMGGIRTVRGYESNSLSPKLSGTDILIGGNTMLVNTVEASFPLVERLKMRGAIFFDYGMIGEDNLDIKRGGTGVALEWISPLGPIGLVFSQPVMDETGDKKASFEFTIGQKF
ncbi:outer membrane protein assembly factor [Sulfurospirillum diekertiae]|uniref:Outer membrane protein assembly factor BamA n=1 Tax=Sulfurospirillum diekertiae TaxID=1854492 RepID=A0A290HA10_9BACT|nr:outer membrane protein assembly factor BamA [Sulfurospirillum diekertiae]ATB68403.1 outer membrane protein assembly factor [Sulfurospirillum diekertiae]